MKQEQFNTIVQDTLKEVEKLLISKGKEYQRNEDVFHNFEVGSRKKNITREKVLDGFLLKHEISIEDMTNDLDENKLPNINTVNEKFLDNIVYLIIKKAMFLDRINKIEF